MKKNKVKVSLYTMPLNSCTWEAAVAATPEQIEEAKQLLKKGEPLQVAFFVPDEGNYTISHMRPATNREILRS